MKLTVDVLNAAITEVNQREREAQAKEGKPFGIASEETHAFSRLHNASKTAALTNKIMQLSAAAIVTANVDPVAAMQGAISSALIIGMRTGLQLAGALEGIEVELPQTEAEPAAA